VGYPCSAEPPYSVSLEAYINSVDHIYKFVVRNGTSAKINSNLIGVKSEHESISTNHSKPMIGNRGVMWIYVLDMMILCSDSSLFTSFQPCGRSMYIHILHKVPHSQAKEKVKS